MKKANEEIAEIKKTVLSANGFPCFNPAQKKVLEKKWGEESIVLSAPTASGKTIAAELCALNTILKKGKKVIYTCPLRALASEHYNDWKKKYSSLGIKMAISTGDFDSSSRYLSKYDLIFTTNEKLDSLITHKAEWLSKTGLLIIDEVHEISGSRGTTLEAVLIKMRSLLPELQLLALSATIPNAQEISDWLNAQLAFSNYRPVKLMEGILFENTVYFKQKTLNLKGNDYVEAILSDTLQLKKQALFFLSTRKKTEQLAKKASNTTEKTLLPKEKLFLKKLSSELLNSLEFPTEQCKSLSDLALKGVAFHHAGLLQKQRTLIEEAFRAGKLKALAATTTLALGINVPAFRVIIPSLYRFTGQGMLRIPVNEYKQLCGRAGRPKYDSVGQSIVIARSEPEMEELSELYLKGELEDVTSMLSFTPVLRSQLLSSISTGFVFDFNSMKHFFEKSLYCKQYGNTDAFFEKLHSLLEDLVKYGFVTEKNKKFFPTMIGKRIAELYLDPESANNMLSKLKNNLSELGVLYCIADTFEFSPLPRIARQKKDAVFSEMLSREKDLGLDNAFFDEFMLEKFNAALMLESWVNEYSEQSLMDDFGMQPGLLHAKLRLCDWLAYSCVELAKLIDSKENIVKFVKMRKRLKHGVKEELIPLTELRFIGRVRARRLFRFGIKSISDLRNTDVEDLSKILGKSIAQNVKKQLRQ